MGLIKNKIQQHKQVHYWSSVWGKNDWDKPENIAILHKIHMEYTECVAFWRRNKSSRLYPVELYQVRNKGMSELGAIIWDVNKSENGEYQVYQINEFMLEKYFKWRDMNMTQDNRLLEQARCREIHKEIVSALKNFNARVAQ